MRIDRSAFKAEVYRRGRERVAARKRAKKRMIVSGVSFAACLAVAVTITPMLVRWEDIAHDCVAEDIASQSTVQTKEEHSIEQGNPGFAGDMDDEDGIPEYDAPLASGPSAALPDEGLTEDPDIAYPKSAEIYSNGSLVRTLDEGDILYDLYVLLVQFEASGSQNGSSEDTDDDGNANCQIILHYHGGECREYIWKGLDWYIVDQDRHIPLTADFYKALEALLLE